MCGIAGIVSEKSADELIQPLRRMVEIMHNRGPDARGEFVQNGILLGHSRLSIIDLSEAGSQPMTDQSGRYTIVYNGEVYNFRDLKNSLFGRFKFKSQTDTEIVLASYIQWGPDCVAKFNGMFAFAIWDSEKRELFFARDRLGIKPLFYSFINGQFVFASEQKAIIASGLVKAVIDEQSIYHFMSFYHIPEPSTAYRGIKSLPAGHRGILSNGELKVSRWWKPDFRKSHITTDYKAADGLRMMLEDSTRIQQVSDVPVGCFLSGGMDSTVVSALMRKEVGEGFRTYTIAFGDDPSNAEDVHYANIASERIGTRHMYRNISMGEISKSLPSILWRLEEPAWTSLESWFVSALAKEGITVSLAGVGGDELFAGYFPYSHIDKTESFKRFMGLLAGVTGQLARLVDALIPDSSKMNPPLSSLHRFAMVENLDYASAYFLLRATFTDEEKKKLLTGDFLKKANSVSSVDYVRGMMKSVTSEGFIDKFTLFDIQNYLSADLLRHMDTMSMAHSLEVRVPLLDHRLVEYVLGLADDMKLRDGKSKYIFKKAIDDLVPEEIKLRRKVGFVFPMKRWLRTEFAMEVNRVLKSQRFIQRGIFNPTFSGRILEQYMAGDESQWLRLWSIMSVELWARMYIDSQIPEPVDVNFTDFVETI